MLAIELANILTIQYRYTTWTFGKALEGLTDEVAYLAPSGGGNCLAWVAGHILDSRAGTLKVLGIEGPFPMNKYSRFSRGSEALGAGESPFALAEVLADFEATTEPLQRGLAGLNDDLVAAAAPFSPGNNAQETVGSLLAGLVFHEAYHVGQLGILRRIGGAEGFIK